MEEDILLKFCVVGEPGVGKTSMLVQYIQKKFDDKIRPTIGCDFSTKLKARSDGQSVRLQLWDVAGQQRFNAVSKMYLRGAIGCIVVCSATDNSLEQALKWKDIISEYEQSVVGLKMPILLVQNKSDLIPDNPSQNQTQAYLDKFAKEHGFFKGIQTSAKDNKNIEEVFQLMLNEAYESPKYKQNKQQRQQANANRNQNIKLGANNNNNQTQPRKKNCC